MAAGETPSSAQIEWVRTSLAIVVGGIGFAAILLFAVYRSLADAQTLAGLTTGMIGVVLGYYFGSKGVDAAQTSAANQTAIRAKTEAAATQYQQRVRSLLQKQREAHLPIYAMSKDELTRDPRAAAVRDTLEGLLTLDWRDLVQETPPTAR